VILLPDVAGVAKLMLYYTRANVHIRRTLTVTGKHKHMLSAVEAANLHDPLPVRQLLHKIHTGALILPRLPPKLHARIQPTGQNSSFISKEVGALISRGHGYNALPAKTAHYGWLHLFPAVAVTELAMTILPACVYAAEFFAVLPTGACVALAAAVG
jgi:hypothetical protein